jgi:hypothetical protein
MHESLTSELKQIYRDWMQSKSKMLQELGQRELALLLEIEARLKRKDDKG